MAANPIIKPIQGLIDKRGVTREQAMTKYGLTPEDADWMSNGVGLKFAPEGAQPMPAALQQAQAQMGYDAAKAKMTPGGPVRSGTSPLPPAQTGGSSAAAPAGGPNTPRAITPVTPATVAATPAPAPAPGAPAPAPAVGTPAPAPGVPTPGGGPVVTPPPTPAPASTPVPDADAAKAVTQPRTVLWRPDEKATVQGQLADIISNGSPLMEQAETRGLQQAASRGLMNSSMGVQSAQAALYDAAMPIATQDANTFAQAGQFNANERNDRNAHNADLQTDVNKFNASESNALTKLGMDNDTRRDLANIEANYKTLMQTSASAGELYKTYMSSIATILQNKDMNAAAKQEAINTIMGSLNSSLDVMGGIANMDIPDLEFQDDVPTGSDGGDSGGDDGGDDGGFSSTVDGRVINWNIRTMTGITLKDEYNQYADSVPGTAMTPTQWVRLRYPGMGSSGSGDDGSAAAAAAAAADAAAANDGASASVSGGTGVGADGVR